MTRERYRLLMRASEAPRDDQVWTRGVNGSEQSGPFVFQAAIAEAAGGTGAGGGSLFARRRSRASLKRS